MDMFSGQFGLLIGCLLPGFIGLIGAARLFPVAAGWLVGAADGSLGPPLYAVLSATTIGMIIGCVRWSTIDQLHAWTGLRAPQWNFRRLESQLGALTYLVDNHYRYYQFYANILVAIVWAYLIHRVLQTSALLGLGTDLGALFLCAILFAGSRDALAKYYARAGQIIGVVTEKETCGAVMTNGIGHHQEGGMSPKPPAEPKPQQPKAAAKPEEKSGNKPAK